MKSSLLGGGGILNQRPYSELLCKIASILNQRPYSELLCKIATLFTPQIPQWNRHYSILHNHGKKQKWWPVPVTEFSHDFLCFWRWQFEPNMGVWNKTMCGAFWTRVLIQNNCAKKPLFWTIILQWLCTLHRVNATFWWFWGKTS